MESGNDWDVVWFFYCTKNTKQINAGWIQIKKKHLSILLFTTEMQDFEETMSRSEWRRFY